VPVAAADDPVSKLTTVTERTTQRRPRPVDLATVPRASRHTHTGLTRASSYTLADTRPAIGVKAAGL
jgi:hypothetical protein